MAEFQTLIDQDIPSGRQALLESHLNLKKVASYCAQKYLSVCFKIGFVLYNNNMLNHVRIVNMVNNVCKIFELGKTIIYFCFFMLCKSIIEQ